MAAETSIGADIGAATGPATRDRRRILYLSGEPWNDRWARRQQLATRLAREPDVEWVLLAAFGTLNPLRALGTDQIADGLWATARLRLPRTSVPGVRAAIAAADGMLHRSAARRWARWDGPANVVVVTHPFQEPAIDQCPGAPFVCFDWTDDWTAFPHLGAADRADLGAATDRLLRRADLVVAVSTDLHTRALRANPASVLIRNGTDIHTLPTGPPDPVIERIRGPRIGYLGQILGRTDLELVGRIADARPEWSLVLVGQVRAVSAAAAAAASRRRNVHVVGSRPHARTGAVLAQFDVCIIPHVEDPLTESMDPVKLYDYFGSGRPIVSTPVAGVERFGDAVRITRGADGFIAAIEASLADRDAGRERRLALARENSWDVRYAELARTLLEHAPRGG